MRLRNSVLPVLICLLSSLTTYSNAAGFPDHPINFIVPYGAGGPTNTVARIIAAEGEATLRQPIVVVNKPGASGTIGTSEVTRSKPDGYTIAYSSAAIVCMQTLVMTLQFSCTEGYQPIIKLFNVPVALTVPVDSPLRTLEDFVKSAQAKPGQLRISVAGRLTEPDLVLEQLKSVAKIDFITVPYSGGAGEALTAALGGHVEGYATTLINLNEYVMGGKLRVIAVFDKTRHPLFPNVSSAREVGYDVALPAMHFVLGPKNMPADAIAALQTMVTKAMSGPKFQELAAHSGFTVDPRGPKEIEAELKEFEPIYSRIARDLKLEKK